ncbi:MAG: hypothetical protein SWJ54_19805, partial [Cyanobacteriota bacterium]|nr:hypothetical protein [Cyanobacteriota bacterium]
MCDCLLPIVLEFRVHLDELPAGRRAIKTTWREAGERAKAYRFVRQQVEEGRQAFIICPLIEESP